MTEAVVVDASALLAMLNGEPGSDVVAAALGIAAMSAVNWSEVVQKVTDRGVSAEGLADEMAALGLEILPFDLEAAELTARLRAAGARGLSLADRACLATARSRRWPVVTADRGWAALDVGVEVRVIR